nr:defensin 5 [Zingiber officinale]
MLQSAEPNEGVAKVVLIKKMAKNGVSTISLVFLFLLLLASSVTEVGAKVCSSKSKSYWGVCFQGHCNSVCKTEGFEGGKCHGILITCKCYKTCT